jgi:hypothetical protein
MWKSSGEISDGARTALLLADRSTDDDLAATSTPRRRILSDVPPPPQGVPPPTPPPPPPPPLPARKLSPVQWVLIIVGGLFVAGFLKGLVDSGSSNPTPVDVPNVSVGAGISIDVTDCVIDETSFATAKVTSFQIRTTASSR